ncbi:hypothetical protein [Kitasatospora fiedleri]|nr:hypothetical protein [Kitasatospora fiedleri]
MPDYNFNGSYGIPAQPVPLPDPPAPPAPQPPVQPAPQQGGK